MSPQDVANVAKDEKKLIKLLPRSIILKESQHVCDSLIISLVNVTRVYWVVVSQ